MENKLLNEIENFRLLYNYNPKKTLNENLLLIEDKQYFLNEGFFLLTESLLANILKGYSDDAIKLLSNELKGLSMFTRAGSEGAEAFLKNLRAGKVAGKQFGEFSTELLKNKRFAGGQTSALMDGAAEAYVKNMAKSKDEAVQIFKNAQPEDRAQMLRVRGYSEPSIKKINQKYDDFLQGKLGPKPEPVPTTVQDRLAAKKKLAGTTDDVAKQANVAKQADGAVPKVPETSAAKATRLQKAKDAIIRYKNQLVSSLKTKGWKRTLAIAAGVGIGGALLWQLAKDNGVQTEDMPAQPPADSNLGGQPITASGTKYETPPELVDVKGIQDFQTWLDTNKPGWHSKYRTLGGNVQKGFGKFGPNTSRAWQDEEIKKTYLASKGQQNPSQEEPLPTKRELEQPVPIDGNRPGISTGVPKTLSTQAPTIQTPQANLTPQEQSKVDRMRKKQQQ